MRTPRRIVFVADDLGISAGVNEGIARAARAGLVHEASACVTGAALEPGLRVARDLGIGVGLHLSFTLGRALTGPIAGLTDADGRFHDLATVLLACLRGRVDAAAVERETEAQLTRLHEFGVAPTHLNGHHHVHCMPVIRDAAFAVAARHDVRWTRLPAEHAAAGGRLRPTRWLLAHLARRSAPLLVEHGLRALPFVGITLEGCRDYAARVLALASRLPPGDFEWMVHPRIPDEAFARLDPRSGPRDGTAREELSALTDADLVRRLAELGITTTTFAAVRDADTARPDLGW